MAGQLPLAEHLQEPTRVEILEEWLHLGYANVPFALGSAACKELFAGFQEFIDLCREPKGDELVAAVTFNVNSIGNGAYHFEYRKPGTINPAEPDRPPGTDHKYVFHFGSQTIKRARNALGKQLPTEMGNFLEHCETFYEAGRNVLRLGATALGIEKVMFTSFRDEDVHHLRLLDYRHTEDTYLGEAHFDRSLLTAALSESLPGLRGAPSHANYLERGAEYIEKVRASLTPIMHTEHQAKIFAAAGVNHLSDHLQSRIRVPLFAHDIVNENPDETRKSVVMFGNPHQRFTNYTAPEWFETGFGNILKYLRNEG